MTQNEENNNLLDHCATIFDTVADNTEGRVATYIPRLASVDASLWGMSVCTTNGEKISKGDSKALFSIQSASKPITYCIALETAGYDVVHQHVDHERSGRNFNERVLLSRGLKHKIPHNPYINAGAIMTAACCHMEKNDWERFDAVLCIWSKLCGGKAPSFQYDTFCSERSTA